MNSISYKAITPLSWRVIAFLCFFVLISGITGPRIISGGILFRDGFWVYGSIGKALIFGLIAFVLLVHHRKVSVAMQKWQPLLFGWIIAASIAFAFALIAMQGLLSDHRTTYYLLTAHGGLLLSTIFIAVGCVGPTNIRLVGHTYKREILLSSVIAILFYGFLFVVYALWRPLASIVLLCVTNLLHVANLHATVIPPNILILDKFGITVAQYCSGIESIALFTGLYGIVGLLDWTLLSKRRYFIVFPFGLLGLFALNIMRVYGLILAGYYINPKIAFSLFHTYAGMVFFILYSAVFWTIAYKRLLAKVAGVVPAGVGTV